MSDEFEEFDFKDKLAAISAEFDQFQAAMMEVAMTVCSYYGELKKSKKFSKEERFMLTMEYQSMVLTAVLTRNIINPEEEV